MPLHSLSVSKCFETLQLLDLINYIDFILQNSIKDLVNTTKVELFTS